MVFVRRLGQLAPRLSAARAPFMRAAASQKFSVDAAAEKFGFKHPEQEEWDKEDAAMKRAHAVSTRHMEAAKGQSAEDYFKGLIAQAQTVKNPEESLAALEAAVNELSWSDLASTLNTSEAKLELQNLRGTFETIIKELSVLRQPPPSVDWAHWKKEISTPGFVDEMKKLYDQVQIPQIEVKPTEKDAAFDKEFAELLASAKKDAADAERALAELTAEMEADAGRKPLREMTIEDVEAAYPALAEQVNKEIEAGEWKI
eukprot:CAMPEP_0114557732 /NCGR_PEP_ID=MMETSP0114-20121206/9992_1 /TAXON_ID=31324 /ORGANISM="Goniomonas sp, Strain m" /LENGTH=257 /DNA_ID=CAMNT_0001743049 /DNA_START=14 /DNA_END=787 /DNA_ORIENTATION=-